jgi:hypothetical protein
MDIYTGTYFKESYILATTNLLLGDGTVVAGDPKGPPGRDWVWGRIRLEDRASGMSAFGKKSLVSHEMGHVMGLDDVTSTGVIMCGTSACTVANAQRDDLNGINALY